MQEPISEVLLPLDTFQLSRSVPARYWEFVNTECKILRWSHASQTTLNQANLPGLRGTVVSSGESQSRLLVQARSRQIPEAS
jgi:hypothetical protein